MKTPTDSVTYASRFYKDAIIRLTAPLKKMQIETFWQYSITHDGHFSTVSAVLDLFEYFWDQKLYLGHPHLRKADFYPTGYHLPHLKPSSDYEKTQGKIREKGYLNQMIIIQRQDKNGLSAYAFAPKIDSPDMTNYFINSIPLLNRYIDFFNEKASTMITKSRDHSIDLSALSNESFYTSPKIINEMLMPKEEREFLLALESDPIRIQFFKSLTEREKSCLYWFLRGRSASETAKRLYLSPRTVESHLENIKNRSGVSKKSELFDYLADWSDFLK